MVSSDEPIGSNIPSVTVSPPFSPPFKTDAAGAATVKPSSAGHQIHAQKGNASILNDPEIDSLFEATINRKIDLDAHLKPVPHKVFKTAADPKVDADVGKVSKPVLMKEREAPPPSTQGAQNTSALHLITGGGTTTNICKEKVVTTMWKNDYSQESLNADILRNRNVTIKGNGVDFQYSSKTVIDSDTANKDLTDNLAKSLAPAQQPPTTGDATPPRLARMLSQSLKGPVTVSIDAEYSSKPGESGLRRNIGQDMERRRIDFVVLGDRIKVTLTDVYTLYELPEDNDPNSIGAMARTAVGYVPVKQVIEMPLALLNKDKPTPADLEGLQTRETYGGFMADTAAVDTWTSKFDNEQRLDNEQRRRLERNTLAQTLFSG